MSSTDHDLFGLFEPLEEKVAGTALQRRVIKRRRRPIPAGMNPPLGGVAPAVIDKVSHTHSVLRAWGVPARNSGKWIEELITLRTLADISETLRSAAEPQTIVSREEDGLWLTGNGDHPRAAILEVLNRHRYVANGKSAENGVFVNEFFILGTR